MTAIRVYDPSMCCNTGVCGTDVEQRLVDFAADVRWAQDRGADVERMNLAQQPTAFAENPKVRAFLEEQGEGGLPLILVDGETVISGRYPDRAELARLAGIPAPEGASASTEAGDGCCGPARDTGCC